MDERPTTHRPLLGGHFAPLDGASHHGRLEEDDAVEVTVVLRADAAPERLYDQDHWLHLPRERRHEIERHHYHAREDDFWQVERFARDHGLEVGERSHERRTVRLCGSAAAIGRAFGVELVRYRHARGHHRGFEGQIHVPHELHDVVRAVLGLHDRPVLRPNLSVTPGGGGPLLTATELAELYEFPPAFTGRGQRIGIIELGGGYRRKDLEAFFDGLGIPHPQIVDVEIDGARNEPEDEAAVRATIEWMNRAVADAASAGAPPEEGGSTIEVTMDIEVAAALAPGAEIVVYFAQPTEHSLFNALHAALEPGGPEVLSLSWSWNERPADHEQEQVDELLERCAVDERTVCVGSGDRGSRGSPARGPDDLNPQFPATSPYTLACGGTTLVLDDGRLAGEVVWNTPEFQESSGGGISRFCPMPKWQEDARVPALPDGSQGRGIPDVAAVADPATHCGIFVGGAWGPAAGTSASAPLWAALAARCNEALGMPIGYTTPLFYRFGREQPELFRQVVEGENGAYSAAHGWDACTGLGGPRGERLLAALRGD